MRSFQSSLLWSLTIALSLTSFVSAGVINAECSAEVCGEDISLRSLEPTSTTSYPNFALTNAQRLSLGLPLNPPKRRRPGSYATRAQVSAVPKNTITGVIQVKRASDDVVVGLLDQTTISIGSFKASTTPATALKVSLDLDIGETSGTALQVTMLNSAGPLLGLVQGRDNVNADLSKGSFHYTYLNGVSLPGSEPGAIPANVVSVYSTSTSLSRAAETSIWSINTVTGAMSAHWINMDGSALEITFWSQGGYLYAGADMASFLARYPSPVLALTLTFIPYVSVEPVVAPIAPVPTPQTSVV